MNGIKMGEYAIAFKNMFVTYDYRNLVIFKYCDVTQKIIKILDAILSYSMDTEYGVKYDNNNLYYLSRNYSDESIHVEHDIIKININDGSEINMGSYKSIKFFDVKDNYIYIYRKGEMHRVDSNGNDITTIFAFYDDIFNVNLKKMKIFNNKIYCHYKYNIDVYSSLKGHKLRNFCLFNEIEINKLKLIDYEYICGVLYVLFSDNSVKVFPTIITKETKQIASPYEMQIINSISNVLKSRGNSRKF